MINVVGNFLILMPIEYLILKIFDIKNFKTNLLIDVIISFTVEILQYITHIGVLYIDDVIGMIIVYFVVRKYHKKSIQAKKN